MAAGKKEDWSKEAFLKEVAKIEGVYVPSFYEHIYNEDGTTTITEYGENGDIIE